MAALTKGKKMERTAGPEPRTLAVPVAANAILYHGSLVNRNATGYAVAAGDTASQKCAGVSVSPDKIDNTGGADGAKTVIVERGGRYKFPTDASITVADLMENACVKTDNEVQDAAAAANDVIVGTIEVIESDGITVFIP